MTRWSPGIRLRLVVLVAAAAGPSLVLSVVRAREAAASAKADAERQAMSEARRLASDVAGDLARQDTLLMALATTVRPTADAEDENNRLLAEAHRLRGKPDEVYIVTDREGLVVGRSNADALRARISVADRDFFRRVMATGTRVIGQPVKLRPTMRYWGVSLARPVVSRDGRPAGIVAVTMRLSALGPLLDDRDLPPGSVITLRDSGMVIARSREAERFVGQRAGTDSQVSLLLEDGMREDTWLDGVRRLTAWTMVPGTGRWQMIVGIPTSAMMSGVAAARAELAFFLAVFVAGLAAAALIARGITRPISELVADADALARGERVHAEPPGPRDLALLADAFNTMSDRVTERTDALQAAELQARVLFAQSPVPMLVVDGTALTIIDANEAAASLLGWTAAELRDRTVESLRPPEDVPRWRAMMASLGEGVTHLGQWRYVHRSGHVIDVELVTARTTLAGASAYLTVVTDVTERLAAERALAEGQDQLRQAQKMEALGRFAGGIAHDFNNLLTAILGQLEVTMDDLPPGSAVRQDLDPVRRSAERMATLTKQILAFGRRQVVKPVALDLCTVVHEFEPTLVRLLPDEVDLAIACGTTPARIIADRAQVEQVVLNLVVNARDAMPEGGTIRVTVELDEIEPTEAMQHGRRAGPAVRLSVRDTGHGIEPALQARIFEPFFTTKAPGKGTGLGLATVYAIMQQAGGIIRVESAPGNGTRFDVLWLAAQATDDGVKASSGPRTAVSAVPPRETVLVVDDEEGIRRLVSTALARLGYTVLTAADGAEAAEVAATHAGPIHLVVTDCVMPRMGGRELAAALRDVRPATKVLFVSGHTDDTTLLAAIAAEQAAFLPKPFTPGTLTARVREVLDG